MLRKFLSVLSLCALLAVALSCGEKDPIDDGTGDSGEKQEQQKEEEGNKLPTTFQTATETVSNMGAGWNLGNTLESNSGDVNNMWIEGWATGKLTPADYEKAWGQVPATRALIHMMKEAGFRSIRVPVTWYPHMGSMTIVKKEIDGQTKPTWDMSTWEGDKVDPVWMARVKEVVDYVLAEDMYCILNVHHDTGTATTHWVVADENSYKQNSARFKSLWRQIAETFKDYDGRLLFEGYNEMTDMANSWCFASFGTGGYDAAMAASAYSAVNSYAQDFVDVVRATGGNNADRNLVVNTYAACSGEGNWNPHLQDPLKEMKLPKDSAKDHIAFQVHYYPTFTTLNAGKSSVDGLISGLKTHLVSKGAPVIIGEWANGESGETISYDKKRTDYLAFAEYFVSRAKANGMATFYWMGISDGQDRAVPKFTQPDLKDAIIKGAAK
ncbi:MAG: glycoside hydrolase family 5 protein [Bacteroidales bacterium]|nr:glycoside hydrolase family 5 protein [Bacteroidales bacterium]